MNIHARQRNQRLGLEHSTSPLAIANHTGILESLILYGLTAALPGLSNAMLGFLTSALTSLATTAIVTGLQYLLMPKPPKPPDGKQPKTQAIPPVIFGYGTNRLAGYYMLWEDYGRSLYVVQAVAGHRCSEFHRYFLHDDEVTLQPDGRVNQLPDGSYGHGDTAWIRVETRLGANPETPYAHHIAALAGAGIWTSNHRGDGQASMGMICLSTNQKYFRQVYPNSAPNLSAVLDMAPVFDFRDDAQTDDEATWTFSKNPVLCLVHWLCFSKYGPKWSFVKSILPVLDRWIEEANICDELIPRAIGGTEPRYEMSGWATTETDPVAILNSFLATCDGHIAQQGDGTLILTVGKFREELVETITDEDIAGYAIEHDVPEEDEINRLVPRFTYPATDYSTGVTDFFESVEDQQKAGRVLSQEADLQWVQQWRQVRRLARREWRRIQMKKRGSLDLRLSGINASTARWVRVQSTAMVPQLNGLVIENRRSNLALMKGGFQMDWRLHPTDIDDWNPSTDEGSVPPVPPKPEKNGIETPVIDSAIAVSNGSTVYISAAVVDPAAADLVVVLQYRIEDTGGGAPGAWVEQSFPDAEAEAGLIIVNTNPVPSDELLQVRAVFMTPGGTYGDFSDIVDVSSTLDTISPGDLSVVSTSGNLLGGVTFNATTPATANVRKLAIYRTPTGVTLNRTTHHVETINVLPNTAYSRNQGDVTRTNLLLTPDFASDTNWTKGTGWSIGSGVASKSAGVISNLYQTLSLSAAAVYRFAYTRASSTAGNIVARLSANNRASAGNDFANAAWTKTNITVTAGAITAGGRTFAKVEATSSAVTTLRQQIAGVGQAGGQTFEIYIKKGSGATDANKFILRNQTTATNIVNISINYDTGVITGATSSNAQAEDVGNGVWRLTLRTSTGISNGDELWLYACFIGASETAAEYAYVGDASLFDGASAQPTAVGTFETTNASHYGALTADAVHTQFQIRAAATTSDGSIDNAVLYERTGSCLPQGTYDIYAEALNGSGVPGGLSGPHTVTII